MVVDAEPVNRMLAVGQLSHLGMRGVAVASGEEAVALLAEGMGPDIVLMDLVLRGIDGLEATRRIRAQEDVHGRRAVIVGLTASSLATDRLVADEAGMDEVLTKPMGLTTLSQAMSRWVAGDGRLPAEPPAVDRDVLASLVEDLGTESVVIDLVHLYLNELPSRRYVLANAADRADLAAAKSMADTLQSTSLLLGATGVAHACQRLSDAEQPVDVDHLVADIVRATTSAHRSLQQWLSERPAPPR
jgi:CheY-like chemotaxis protein